MFFVLLLDVNDTLMFLSLSSHSHCVFSCFIRTFINADFGDLYPKAQRRIDNVDVLNGISISKDPDIIYMTGKNWDRMYLIKLLY